MANRLVFIVCIVSIFNVSAVLAQGDADSGALKIQTCAICHGSNGNSINPIWPKLAGQHPKYTTKQLQDFKTGRRPNPQMSPIASTLSEQDMIDIATYYASQTSAKSQVSTSTDPKDIELGERVYRAGDKTKNMPSCMACHGPTAKGNPAAMYPSLAGQHAAYTAAQLKAFKAESRANDANMIMRNIALKLTNEEIEAISKYLQELY